MALTVYLVVGYTYNYLQYNITQYTHNLYFVRSCVSAAVRLHHDLCGCVSTRAAVRAAQQLARNPTRRQQVHLRNAPSDRRSMPRHRRLVHDPRCSRKTRRHQQRTSGRHLYHVSMLYVNYRSEPSGQTYLYMHVCKTEYSVRLHAIVYTCVVDIFH